MEGILKKIAFLFILCMLAIILIFIGINYQSDQDAKKLKNEKTVEVKKKEKETKEVEEKTEETENNTTEEKEEINNNSTNNSSNTNTNNTSTNTNTNESNNNTTSNNSTVAISKFSARINNNRLYIGETANITTTIYPENATVQEVSYSSSDNNIAIVSKDGVVTGVNIGDCEIRISVKGVENSGIIKVHVISRNNTTYEEVKEDNQ